MSWTRIHPLMFIANSAWMHVVTPAHWWRLLHTPTVMGTQLMSQLQNCPDAEAR
jgi:hypothetical protein